MPETFGNWAGLVNNCVYYAHPTRDIYWLLPYSVISRSFEIRWLRQYLVNVESFGIKDKVL